MVRLVKYISSIVCIAVILSMTTCFAQSISTSGTPYQEGFAAGNGGSALQSTPITETPSQVAFETTGSQTGSLTAGYNVSISKVIKEGDALHVVVANSGAVAADLTDWKLYLNKGAKEYKFPSFKLDPNSIVTVHTHENVNTVTDLYASNFTWNGTRDLELIDQTGKLVSEYALLTS